MNINYSSSDISKPVIIMQTGPLHLFWTTGVFYFWTLKKKFNIILIVPDTYREDTKFKKIETLNEVLCVEYLSSKKSLVSRLTRFSNFSNIFKRLLLKVKPVYILLHNQNYIENLYLMHWARNICPKVPFYFFQNGSINPNMKDDFLVRRSIKVQNYLERKLLSHISKNIVGTVVDVTNWLQFRLKFKFIPWIVIHKVFNPHINVYGGYIDKDAGRNLSSSDKDYQFAYLDNEIDVFNALGLCNIVKVRHPLMDCNEEVFKFLYDEGFDEANNILILPSYGHNAQLIASGQNPSQLTSNISDKWIKIIEELQDQFPEYSVSIKLHPNSASDEIWKKIIQTILSAYPELKVVDTSESAEWCIVKSKVIVGDVTSALWWAGLYGGKIVISFDVFGYSMGGAMKKYQEILNYVDEDLFIKNKHNIYRKSTITRDESTSILSILNQK